VQQIKVDKLNKRTYDSESSNIKQKNVKNVKNRPMQN